MSRRDEILARYEKSLFTLLMSEAAEWEGGRLLEEAERLNRDPAAEVPEAVSERCRRALRREFSRKGAAKFRRGLGRGLKAALAAACAASLLFTAAFAVSEEVRTYAVNLFIEIKDYCTSFSFTSGSEEEPPLESPFFTVGWLPEGFTLCSQERRGSAMPSQSNTYKGPREKELFVDVDSISEYGVVSFDTENAASEEIILNGQAGTFYTKSYTEEVQETTGLAGQYLLIMPIPEKRWIFSVLLTTDFSPGDKEAVLRVAESVELDGLQEEGTSSKTVVRDSRGGPHVSLQPGWLPEGCELVRELCHEWDASSYYRGPREENLSISLGPAIGDSALKPDIEGVVEEGITVNGVPGVFRTREDPEDLIPFQYELSVPIPETPGGFAVYWGSQYAPEEDVKDTLLRIAENLTWTDGAKEETA
ncbi:hypothetical protein [uncultured Oscillibacter sp.]|jgi:hypothetical protein|uniref:hypothetical protein n=1 Tax=uncultured Oscillibacter sp. TaxID=876091 RepID=UPI002624CB63|nr:hypothetical protein [uncultured Oscillibacter sp.]